MGKTPVHFFEGGVHRGGLEVADRLGIHGTEVGLELQCSRFCRAILAIHVVRHRVGDIWLLRRNGW